MSSTGIPKNYGDYTLPFYGAIYQRNLKFPNSNYNSQIDYIPLKNIINPRQCKSNSFGKTNKTMYGNLWYPQMYIDNMYNPYHGGYINVNGPLGPYFALGQGNYPRSMYKEVYFGKKRKSPKRKSPKKKSPKRKSPKRKSPKRKSPKRKSPKRKNKITYCLPKDKKYPVNTKKRCSAALSYARYAPSPCRIARCVKKNCSKKYPSVGKTSKLMKKCKIKI